MISLAKIVLSDKTETKNMPFFDKTETNNPPFPDKTETLAYGRWLMARYTQRSRFLALGDAKTQKIVVR